MSRSVHDASRGRRAARSVAIRQLVHVSIGLARHHWMAAVAASWKPVRQQASSLSIAAVMVLGIGSSWERIVSLLGGTTLLAAAAFTRLSAIAAGVLTIGRSPESRAMGQVSPSPGTRSVEPGSLVVRQRMNEVSS